MINGAKALIVNAPLARLFVVDANIDGRVRALLVPADAPGLTIRGPAQSRGWYHGVCGDIDLKDCKVPAANVRDALVFLHSGNGAADTKLRIAETLAGYARG